MVVWDAHAIEEDLVEVDGTGWHGGHDGTQDVAVAKFDHTGAPLWARQIGSSDRNGPSVSNSDSGNAIALDPSGNPVITGYSGEAPLAGAPDGVYGDYNDIFIAKLKAHGPTDS